MQKADLLLFHNNNKEALHKTTIKELSWIFKGVVSMVCESVSKFTFLNVTQMIASRSFQEHFLMYSHSIIQSKDTIAVKLEAKREDSVGQRQEWTVRAQSTLQRASRNIADSEHCQAKSEEVSSTLDRHHSNYDQHPYEHSTFTARDSDINETDLEGQIISITDPTEGQQPITNPYAPVQFDAPPSFQNTLISRPRRSSRAPSKKHKKSRKVRTTITKQKLADMNRIFLEYTTQKEEGKNPQFNLKEIGQQLHLGYSTILHKFREFRATKRVRGGALIASLQKKRKYKKSVQIERIIERALTERPFYTAVQLSKYILIKYNRNFSRSIISRHLGEMGYSYKNLKSTPIEKNKQKYKEIRRMYAELMIPLLSNERTQKTVIYVDQMACSLSSFLKRKGTEFKRASQPKEEEEYVSVLVAARNEEVVYYQVRQGFPSRSDFCNALRCIRAKMNQLLKYQGGGQQLPLVIVSDLNRIHRDVDCDGDCVRETLNSLNMHQYFLPPFSFQLNPLETVFLNIKNRVGKRDIHSAQELYKQITMYMRELEKQNVEVHFKEIPEWLQKSLREDNF